MADVTRVLVVPDDLAHQTNLVQFVENSIHGDVEISSASRLSHALGYLQQDDFSVCICNRDAIDNDLVGLYRTLENLELEIPVVVALEISDARFEIQVVQRGVSSGSAERLQNEDAAHALRNAVDRGQTYHRIKQLLLRDHLTRVYSRTYLEHHIEREISRNERTQDIDSTLILVDVDCFPDIVNNVGHAASDVILQQVALRISEAVRGIDSIGRFGRDEFMILAYDAGVEGARKLAGRVQDRISSSPFHAEESHVPLEVCIGIAPMTSKTVSVYDWEEAAQEAVLQARTSDDRIIVSE